MPRVSATSLPAKDWRTSIGWLSGVVAVGIIRAALDAVGSRLAFRAARRVLSEKRKMAVAALGARSPLDIDRPASGLAASVVAEQAEAIVPYLSRFRPARLKATIVPIVIFLCVLPLSWVAAIVLLISAPLIPLFMALIGWRAKAASEKQLVEMGGMNAFLLDRLRGLATIRSLDAVDLTAQRLRSNAESLRVAHDGGASDCISVVRGARAVRCTGRRHGRGLYWFSPPRTAEFWRLGRPL